MDSDLILESFNLDPMNMLYGSTEFSILVESNNKEFDVAVSNASKGTTKKNLLQKIWAFIKKILGLISRGVAAIIRFIKSLFKRKTKGVDQIAEELSLPISPLTPKSEEQSSRVELPSNPASEVDVPKDINCIFKPLQIKINNDESIGITLSEVNARNFGMRDSGKAPGHEQVRYSDATNAISLMQQPALLDELVNVAKAIKVGLDSGKIDEFFNGWTRWDMKFNARGIDSDSKITIKQMEYFQLKFNEIMKELEALGDLENHNNLNNNRVIDKLNGFAGFCGRVQMGMNNISGALQQLYVIDAKYRNCIKDVETLSMFVDKCIQSAIPPKYISYNAYLVSNVNLKGDGSEGNENHPRWGQTRVVFFPIDNRTVIHKIALSGYGVRCNRNEYRITDKFKSEGGSDLLALVVSHTPSFGIITAERVNIPGDISSSELEKIRTKVRLFANKKNLPIAITDIHSGNVGVKHKNYVITDYGNNARKAPDESV
jgi:hypothetical protein